MNRIFFIALLAALLTNCTSTVPELTDTPIPSSPPTAQTPTPATETPTGSTVVTITTEDHVELTGTLFGTGETAIVLAHQGTEGADQTTWHPFAQVLADHGFTALAFDFRGRGASGGPFSPRDLGKDAEAAIQFLIDQGHQDIICMGASMGGTACVKAALDGYPLKAIAIIASTLTAGGGGNSLSLQLTDLANLNLPKLFLTADSDYPRVVQDMQDMFDAAREPKELHMLPGFAHGTYLFDTRVGDDMSAILLGFLANPGGSPYQSAVLETQLTGTPGPVYSLAWSPDGRWLATAGYQLVRIWDVETIQEYKLLEEPNYYVWGVAWSPDGRYLAGASMDGFVQLWDTTTFENIGSLSSGGAFSVAWSPDSQQLAVGTQQGNTQIWEVETKHLERELTGYSLVVSLGWNPSNNLLAQGLLDGGINLWDPLSGELEKSLSGYSHARSDTNGLAWSAEGAQLATAHQDTQVRIWDIASGEQLSFSPLSGHQGWVRPVAWSRDGRCLASGGEDSQVRIWDSTDGRLLGVFYNASRPVWSAAWSPNGEFLAVGDGVYDNRNESGTIWIWKINGCGATPDE